MNTNGTPMMRSVRMSNGTHGCVYGCCTDWPPGGRAARSHRRIVRTQEKNAWRRDLERNRY